MSIGGGKLCLLGRASPTRLFVSLDLSHLISSTLGTRPRRTTVCTLKDTMIRTLREDTMPQDVALYLSEVQVSSLLYHVTCLQVR